MECFDCLEPPSLPFLAFVLCPGNGLPIWLHDKACPEFASSTRVPDGSQT